VCVSIVLNFDTTIVPVATRDKVRRHPRERLDVPALTPAVSSERLQDQDRPPRAVGCDDYTAIEPCVATPRLSFGLRGRAQRHVVAPQRVAGPVGGGGARRHPAGRDGATGGYGTGARATPRHRVSDGAREPDLVGAHWQRAERHRRRGGSAECRVASLRNPPPRRRAPGHERSLGRSGSSPSLARGSVRKRWLEFDEVIHERADTTRRAELGQGEEPDVTTVRGLHGADTA
jgi:hypothetical protein